MAATTPPKKRRKPNLDTLLSGARLPERSVSLCLRADLQADYEDLQRQLEEAQRQKRERLTDAAPGQQIAAQMDELREQMADAVVDFRLRALPPKRWRDLVAAHPSADPKQQLNPDTFGPALIRVSVVDPEMSDEQWERLLSDDGILSSAQFDVLFDAAWNLNRQDPRVPFSRLASVVTNGSAPS